MEIFDIKILKSFVFMPSTSFQLADVHLADLPELYGTDI